MKFIIFLKICVLMSFLGFQAHAAIPENPERISDWQSGHQSIRGGEAKSRISLRDLRHSYSAASGVERLVIDFGDQRFNPLRGKPGYFQIEIKPNPPQMIINLSSTINSKLETKNLQMALKKSRLISAARIDFDRTNTSLNLIFNLKGPVSSRSYMVPSQKKIAQLIVDLKKSEPVRATQKGPRKLKK